MIFDCNEINPQPRVISKAVDILNKGGLIIYPTDTTYAYGCDITNKKGIEAIKRLKMDNKNKPLTFIFNNISNMNSYVRNMSDSSFKIMKRLVPGPFTFIFQASKLVPKLAQTNQKTVGVRIPANNIALFLVMELGRPIISSSVNLLDGEYLENPLDLEKRNRNEIDLVIDSGIKDPEPSTIIDFSTGQINILREGKGIDLFNKM